MTFILKLSWNVKRVQRLMLFSILFEGDREREREFNICLSILFLSQQDILILKKFKA